MNPTDPIVDGFAYSLNFLRELVADLSAKEMVLQSEQIKNHPAWVIGHLAFSCQAIGGEIGLKSWLADNWGQRFGMGSEPVSDVVAYEDKAELLAILSDAQGRITKAVNNLPPQQLASPLPDDNYQNELPSIHHAIHQILIAHPAYHAGQTVIWRRAIGLPKINRPFL